MPTIGAIAGQFGVAVHQVEYVIAKLQVSPIGRAGSALVYSNSDVELIGQELARIRRDRVERRRSEEVAHV